MRRNSYIRLLFLPLLVCCLIIGKVTAQNPSAQNYKVKIKKLDWFDGSRNRQIPVAIYTSETDKKIKKQRIVIFSHGYGKNQGGDYLNYSYLTENLAAKGFFVVSIQHELSTDELIPSVGVPQIVRRPFWDRGAENILFVVNKLKKDYPKLDFKRITLIGHSNGGDMTALFLQKYPGIADKIITLDNRRMPLPKTSYPKIYSLRSSDQKADEGVLPTAEEQKKFGITVIKLPNTIHDDMNDKATVEQRKEINDYILKFLTEPAK